MAAPGITYEILAGAHKIEMAHADAFTSPFPGMQHVLASALSDAVPSLNAEAAAEFVRMDDPQGFYESRHDPNVDVRNGRLRQGQSYNNPVVVLAKHDHAVIGYAHGANNVSGSRFEQFYKSMTNAKKYAWIREIAVLPEHQRTGVGTALGMFAVKALNPNLKRPISAHLIAESDSIHDYVHSLELVLETGEPVSHTTASGNSSYTTQPTYSRDAQAAYKNLLARIQKS